MVQGIARELVKVTIVEAISVAHVVGIEAIAGLVAAHEEKGGTSRIEGVEDADGRTGSDAKFPHVGVSGVVHLRAVGERQVDAALSENLDHVEARVAVRTIQGAPPVAEFRSQLNGDGHRRRVAPATAEAAAGS